MAVVPTQLIQGMTGMTRTSGSMNSCFRSSLADHLCRTEDCVACLGWDGMGISTDIDDVRCEYSCGEGELRVRKKGSS